MSQQLGLRGAAGATLASFVGAIKEVLVDTTNWRLLVQDGSTMGGFPTARLDEVGSLRVLVRGVNLHATGDTAVAIALPPGYSRYAVIATIATNPSAVPTSAKFGVYTAAAQGGTPINSPAQQTVTISTISPNTSGNTSTLTLAAAGLASFNAATLFINVGTASAAACTVDIIIKIDPLS